MKVNYFREMKNHHMVVTAGEPVCPGYQLRMAQENQISGLLRPEMRLMDGETEYDYLITGCISLQTMIEAEPLSGKMLTVLVEGVCGVLEELERYMIDGEYLALRPEFIYLERSGGTFVGVKLCLFPFRREGVDTQLHELMRYVINQVDYQETAAVNLAYELFQETSLEDVNVSRLSALIQTTKFLGQEQSEVNVLSALNGGSAVATDAGKTEEQVDVVAVSLEEVLWIDEKKDEKRIVKKSAKRKVPTKKEITLPAHEKRSILNMISRR